MPKAKSRDTNQGKTRQPSFKPYSKSTSNTSPAKARTGKDSHLYTDDNPETTLHGTGFKDEATAMRTVDLVSKRSLLYQFQTINTMYFRAKHHPHSSGNKNIQAAMAVFKVWLDETYPAAKASQPKFDPVLRKDVVENFLPVIREASGIDEKWAEMYVALPKGKRLANVLMDDKKPGEADMAKLRQDVLEDLIADKVSSDTDDDLWNEAGTYPSTWHLKCIAYGWSPVTAQRLAKCSAT